MGKKRPPLRKIFSSSRGAKSKSSKSSAAEDDDEVDWEALEKQQSGQDGDEEDEGDDEDEDSDSGGIRLDSNIEHVMEEFTFEFNDMREEYAEGVCMMLRKMVVNPTDAYSLASLITQQNIVGTVVNCEGGQDSFAFATVLPLRKVEQVAPMQTILSALRDSLDHEISSSVGDKGTEGFALLYDCLCVDEAVGTKVSAGPAQGQRRSRSNSISISTAGVLLHKRFTNMPPELVSALHRNLEEDMSWAQQQAAEEEDEEDAEKKSKKAAKASSNSSSSSQPEQGGNFFASARYVISLCECVVSKDKKTKQSEYLLTPSRLSPGTGITAAPSPTEGSYCYNVLGSCSGLAFELFEDEVYLQHAVAAVLFRPPRNTCADNIDLVALLLPISKLKTCSNSITAMI